MEGSNHSRIWQFISLQPLALSQKDLHIWRVPLCANLNQIAHYHQILSEDEIKRAKQFKFEIHEQHFVIARASLRYLLACYLQCDPKTIQFNYNEHGKPSLAEPCMVSSNPLYFNLSHAKDLALYVIGHYENLGIDIEYISRDVEIDSITRRFFAPQEVLALRNLSHLQKLNAFFKIWTCKEAFIKALGKGLSFSLQDFEVSLSDESPEILYIKDKDASSWSLFTLNPEENYLGAVAVQGRVEDKKFFTTSFP